MKKEKHIFEYYNSLIDILSKINLLKYSSLDEEQLEIVNKIEKVSMETLNNFENYNFNKPNYFYKEKHVTPISHILLIIKKDDEYLFLEKNNESETLDFYPELFLSLEEGIDEYLASLSLDLTFKDFTLKEIRHVKSLEDNNLFIPLSEYIFPYFHEVKSDLKLPSNLTFKSKDLINNSINLKKEIKNELFLDIINNIK